LGLFAAFLQFEADSVKIVYVYVLVSAFRSVRFVLQFYAPAAAAA